MHASVRRDRRLFAEAIALQAGDILRSRLGTRLHAISKGDRDYVTEADTQAETLIVSAIRERFPSASILSEETGLNRRGDDELWIIDPLDGTTNYLHGYPMFCVSIAFLSRGQREVGVIYAPTTNEMFSAALGDGARLNDAIISVSQINHLHNALLCAGFSPATFARYGHSLGNLYAQAQGIRHDGSAALNLAYTAAGRFDGYWEIGIKAWDIAAGTLIVQEAGGHVSDLRESNEHMDLYGGRILATNHRLHEKLALFLRDL